jgi:hypothetical protein
VRSSSTSSDSSAAPSAAPIAQPVVVADGAGSPAVAGSLRAETDIAAVRALQSAVLDGARSADGGGGQQAAAGWSETSVAGSSSRATEDVRAGRSGKLWQAMQEARAACEQIVIPLQQPVELMPRDAEVVKVCMSACRFVMRPVFNRCLTSRSVSLLCVHASVLQAQAQLVEAEYELQCEVLSTDAGAVRLRVLPQQQ